MHGKIIFSALFILSCYLGFVITGCTKKLDPHPLSLTVKQNLALLQSDPQFVMYFNFRKMRETKFWEQFISDSLFNSERNFGSFLNILKEATGVSITNGIDELYFSNSWIGENALIVKGTFDKKRVDDYISKDTLYTKANYPGGITVYRQTETSFNFYFKDDFTICASNYMKQLEKTFTASDTSMTGVLANTELLRNVERIKYKENLWMISTQKLFIRGIFENFSDMSKPKTSSPGGESDSLMVPDTTENNTNQDNKNELYSIYKKINAVSFSMKMTEELEIIMQNECEDPGAAKELKNRFEAVIALAKLSSSFANKNPGPIIKLLDKVDINVYDRTTLLDAKLDEGDITEIRRQKLF